MKVVKGKLGKIIMNKEIDEILLINGVNLNLLGKREPQIYGKKTLKEVVETIKDLAQKSDKKIVDFQSNHEGEIVDFIQATLSKKNSIKGIIINPGAFTHTSVAIRDALLTLDVPIIEVHISNIFSREKFRHKSYISDIAKAVISGLGVFGYEAALGYFLTKDD